MRAIAITGPWAEQIARGEKRTEHRTRKLAAGPLVIASGGKAVCLVELVKCTGEPGAYVWHLARPRRLERLALPRFVGWVRNVPDELVRPLDGRPLPASSPTKRPAARSSPTTPRKRPARTGALYDGREGLDGCPWCFVDASGEPIREELPDALPWS